MLAAPTVYDQKVYFTTYTPNTTPCSQNGDARLYVVDYLTGAGLLDGGARSEIVGQGIPSGAVISGNPYGDYNVYITTSADQSGSGGGGTGTPPDNSIRHTKLKYFIYWKDNRIQ
jgi:Tfp pilus tip-associated adhesin PilY1